MRYGLLADVHANLSALETALDALRERGVERFVCAGDIVGYGPQPDECVDILRSVDAICVAGNHELILLDRLPDIGIHPWATETLRWSRTRMAAENMDWIGSLPTRSDLPDGVTIAHGSLEDPCTYVRTEQLGREQLDRLSESRFLVLGHTHEQLLVEAAGKLLVNPGAVGQTRERRIRAAAAVLDTSDASVSFMAVPYDTRATERALRRSGLPPGTYRLHRSLITRIVQRLERIR